MCGPRQAVVFGFSQQQIGVLGAGGLAVVGCLYFFRPQEFPGWPKALVAPLRIMGRYTLELYVAHIVLFVGLAAWLSPGRFHFPSWHWTGIAP
jgi:hypothetical protein